MAGVLLGLVSSEEDIDVPDLPIVCTLLPGELNARAMQLLPGLAATATNRLTIDGGWRFEFPATSETLSAIVAMVDAERQCCRFLRFQLTLEPDEGPVRLDVTGPAGTQEFLRVLLDPQ
jgi:hypothetical protein